MHAQVLFHGTVRAFERFRIPASGVHFGSLDQAAHVATVRLASLPIEEFSDLAPDASGFRGIIVMAEISYSNPKTVRDQLDEDGWAKAIRIAQTAGHDCLLYENAFEGRARGQSAVVWNPAQIRILEARHNPTKDKAAA